jgi:Carboxypeptidase regulatory-like domain
MRTPALLLALLLALYGAWVLWSEGRDTAVAATEAVCPSVSSSSDVDPAEVLVDGLAEGDPTPGRVPANAGGVLRGITTPNPDLQVSGQAVGDDGAPLEGLRVVLYSLRGHWAEGLEVENVSVDDGEFEGFSTRTDTSGAFHFAVPPPTTRWTVLRVEPDEFHAPCIRGLGRPGENVEAGPKDLGRLVLASTGAIEGHVRGPDGTPIEGAWVRCEGSSTRSDTEGRYVLGGVHESTVRVTAHADGRLWTQSPWVSVQARQPTRDLDFVLERSPTISGRVFDEREEPIAGARLRSISTSSQHGFYLGASETTSRDGSFTLRLKDAVPQRIEVSAPGFEPYDNLETGSIEPGTTGLRIVLAQARSMTIQVVDADSGLAVDRYGIDLQVERPGSSSSGSARSLEIEDHPRGICTLARIRGPAVVHVEAEGHALTSIEVPASVEEHLILRLERGARVVGRVLSGSKPVPSARACLMRAASEIPQLCTDGASPDTVPRAYGFDLSNFEGRFRDASTDADGRFHFQNLASGTYVLRIREGQSAPFELNALSVRGTSTVDVGDIVLQAGATLRGRIVGAHERREHVWRVGLGESPTQFLIPVGPDDRYELPGLSPGRHEILLQGSGWRSPVRMQEVTLGAGETREIDLDVSSFEPGIVEVRLTRRGRPLVGYQVRTSCTAPKTEEHEFGQPTDGEGRMVAMLAPCDAIAWIVEAPSGIRLNGSSTTSAIPAGGKFDVEIEVEAGELALGFPFGFVFPSDGEMEVTLRSATGRNRTSHVTRLVHPGRVSGAGSIAWNEGDIELGLVPPGDYRVFVSVLSPTASPLGGAARKLGFTSSLKGRVEVEGGMRATCALEARAPRRTDGK